MNIEVKVFAECKFLLELSDCTHEKQIINIQKRKRGFPSSMCPIQIAQIAR